MKCYFTIIFGVGLAVMTLQTSVAANLTKYQWSDDFCDKEGYYDASLITVQNIEDGFEIFRRLTQVNLPSYAPYKPSDLRQLDATLLDKIDNDYLQIDEKISALTTIPRQSGFDMVFSKQKLRQSISNEYQLNRLGLLAYLDTPKALTIAPKVCQQYLTPLTQGAVQTQNAWRDYTLERIKKQEKLDNTNYRTLAMSRYRSEKSENEVAYAKLDLIGYAWHNCVNQHYSEQRLTPEQVNKAQQAFEKVVFKDTVTEKCAMP